MLRLTEQEQQEIIRSIEADKPLPDKFRFPFENDWLSFRTRKNRKMELKSVFHECLPGRGRLALAVKVVDIFSSDTMTIVEVTI